MAHQELKLDILTGHDPARFEQLLNVQLYNLYIYNNALVPTAGFKQAGQFNQQNKVARHIFVSDTENEMFVVYADEVFLIKKDLTSQFIGTLETQSGEISAIENHVNAIAWSDLKHIYVFDTNDKSFSKANIEFTPGRLSFQDTRGIVNVIGKKEFRISSINKLNTWPALQEGVDNQIASTTVGTAVLKRQVLIMGESITDIYYDQGLPNFPYVKANTISYEYGCLSRPSIVEGFGKCCWLAINKNASPIIVCTEGNRLQKISTENIDDVLDAMKKPEDCDGILYEFSGHIFYHLNFFSDNFSMVYDFKTEKFTVVTNTRLGLFPIKNMVRFNNTHYGINYNDGKLYEVNTCFYTNDGETVVRKGLLPTVQNLRKNIQCNQVDVDIAQGNTKVKEPGKFFLKISKDRSATFRITQQKELAITGKRNELLAFRNLGLSRFWTLGYEIYSKGEVVLRGVSMWVRFRGGQS